MPTVFASPPCYVAAGNRRHILADWDLLLTNARIAAVDEGGGYGIVDGPAELAVRDGCIAWVGPAAERPPGRAAAEHSVSGNWITPALIDCHTHLVFAGDRAAEFEQRLRGSSYEAIARGGGGIMSTVKATREASVAALFEAAERRVLALAGEGVGTVEIKSGYGLTVGDELKMLRVARLLGEQTALTVRTTLLAAHAVPPEYAGDADSYVDLICDELLPEVAAAGLADAVDAYCESIAFSVAQLRRLFTRCLELNLPVKLHADQLSAGGGAELAAEFAALSADHLEYTSATGVAALARSGSAAVLLPGAYLTLGETQAPPVGALREAGVPMAVATDCNPGTSPICSLHLAMLLAARLFGLTPEECLAGTTRQAARALGLSDRGSLAVGQRAD
ncbi:MAG: imidazolonepropionase, partial [Pseudomonadota bacterium]